MTEITLHGVIIKFPFKPYQVQEDYMSKIIQCLQEGKNGVLESPTGTGKTLSLLCSSLGWLMVKKAQIQMQAQSIGAVDQVSSGNTFVDSFAKNLNKGGGKASIQASAFGPVMPKIIYASRTHSQLTQAIQELKRTSYKHMNVTVLGSRDQLCINPEVAKEQNSSLKNHMCQAKVKEKSCIYYMKTLEIAKNPILTDKILDIEDLVKTGTKMHCCPYYLSKEFKETADIIFMPYNYLLDPKIRKNQGVDLLNNIVLLDEAHNVEKICEEAASLQISSTDIAVCIDEITTAMQCYDDKSIEGNDLNNFGFETSNVETIDFSREDLMNLKAMFLNFEKAVDDINITKSDEGETFSGDYIFNLLAKADIVQGKDILVIDKLEKIILYLNTVYKQSMIRKGNALQKFCDFLRIIFSGITNPKYREKKKMCYKTYIQMEQPKKSFKNDVWETKKTIKSNAKLISYWCFSPEFGMQQLLDQGVRSVILTSGTLSPMKPFISEIGIQIDVQLENPHIVSEKQICIGIISSGCDGYSLNSSFNTRNDPKYIASLGDTVKTLSYILPHGLLIFFPSYPIMKKCQEEWQKNGKWSQIEAIKPIFVEPQSKYNFNNIINEYYKKIQDPMCRGAIFMGVCRGKVSEGLDFANANGRAVLITGLPFPPLKDPRIILKQRYLEENRSSGKESLTGQQWYQLEASRAVNQAIGRIIRHKNDYGVILLCDCRFENVSFQQQLSAWLRPHIKKFQDFKMVVKELREFFTYTKKNFPQSMVKGSYATDEMSLPAVPAQFITSGSRSLQSGSNVKVQQPVKIDDNFDLSIYKTEQNSIQTNNKEISAYNASFSSLFEAKSKNIVNFTTCTLQKSNLTSQEIQTSNEPSAKRRKVKIKPINFNTNEPKVTSASTLSNTTKESQQNLIEDNIAAKQEQGKQYFKKVKQSLTQENYKIFRNIIASYPKNEISFDELLKTLKNLFLIEHKMKNLLIGFKIFVRKEHIKAFDDYIISLEGFSK